MQGAPPILGREREAWCATGVRFIRVPSMQTSARWVRMPVNWRTRDLPLPALILLCLTLIGLHLRLVSKEAADAGTGGWRHIDRAALERRIESGDLRDVRADWYHPTRPDEGPFDQGSFGTSE